MKDPKLWHSNKQCPQCGAKANPSIYSCETGCDCCSGKCAKEHVKANEKP